MYNGKYDKPLGQQPTVQETGAYGGKLGVQYKALISKLDVAENKVIDYVNNRWPAPNTFDGFLDTVLALNVERATFTDEINAFKAATQKPISKRFRA